MLTVTPDRSTWADRFQFEQDQAGARHGSDGEFTVTVLPDADDAKVYRRVLQSVEVAPQGVVPTTRKAVLVAELNGVKVYIAENSVVVTTQKLA